MRTHDNTQGEVGCRLVGRRRARGRLPDLSDHEPGGERELPRGRRLRLATAFGLVLATAPWSAAQNLLVNPDFDTDVAGWTTWGTDVSIVWNPEDAYGSPASGSGEVINSYVGSASQLRAFQCVSVVGGALHQLRGKVLIPSGQPTIQGGLLGIWWYAEESCQAWISSAGSPLVVWPEDVWIEIAAPLSEAPIAAQSARISLEVFQLAPGGTVSVLYDDLMFGEVLFADGFESGDTSAWSATGP